MLHTHEATGSSPVVSTKSHRNHLIPVTFFYNLQLFLALNFCRFFKTHNLTHTGKGVESTCLLYTSSVIERAEEPYVKVNIIAPNEYVGNIMPMCQDRRGEFKDMQYLDTHLVELHYQMPLNEIIYDFFDALKANTKGYASLDYELSGYRPSDLVKVDLLLNGDQVDALSFIAHRDKACLLYTSTICWAGRWHGTAVC